MTAKYICFEGIDGSGKTSQIELLADQMVRAGITPILLCEPSYGPFGREARKRMAAHTIGDMQQQRELFTLDRIDHVKRKIEPALAFVRNTPRFAILQSRSYLSAPAYQSEGMAAAELRARVEIEARLTPAPDLIVILDLPAEEAVRRLQRARRPDMFETADALEAVRQRYRSLAEIAAHCVLVSAAEDLAAVNLRVREAIGKFEEG
jgi:dTMP kinase